MKTPFYAGLFLIISLAILGLIGYAADQKQRREAAEAKGIELSLELAGAKRAQEVGPKEIIKFVEVPVAVKQAVKEGTLTPVTGVKVGAISQPVPIPCPEPEVVPTGQPAPPSTYRFTNVRFGLTGEIFVGKVAAGAVEATAALKATVFGDNGFHAPVVFLPEDVDIDIVFSKEVTRAIESYREPWIKKHTAFACPGIGITYNPLNARSVDLALTCGYSLVWF